MTYMPIIVKDIPYTVHIGRDAKGYPHWHSEMELLICLSGNMSVDLENQQYELQEGDALILPGYITHSARSDCMTSWRVAVNFGYGLLKSGYPSIQNICLYIPADAVDIPSELRAPLEALRRIFLADTPFTENEWRIRANLLLLCAYLQDTAPVQMPTEDRQNRIRRLENIYSVLDHVAKHYQKKISVEEMAALTGYAKTYFCKQFKSIIGIPFYRYLTCYRISVACTLLDNPRNSISDIAALTGFSTQTLFCRAFKEITSLTPKQFRMLPQAEKSMTWMK